MDNKENKITGIRAYLPAFGAKGWIITAFAICFYYFYQGPIQFGSNFFFGYFEQAFGWSNQLISSAITIGSIVGIVSIVFWAPLNKKWGAKKLSITGLILAALSTCIFAFAPSKVTLYISVILYACSSIAFVQIAVAQFGADWFPHTKGMYMGMATMGLTAGSATFTLITSKLVPSWGLTQTLLMWAGIEVVIAILVGIFAKNTPEEAGAWPDNDKSVTREQLNAEAAAAAEYKKHSPWTLKKVLSCKYTWTIAIGWGFIMMCAGGFISQLVPTLISFGHEPTLGIVLLSSCWPCGVIGNWLGGVIDNKFGTRTASMIVAIVDCLACVCLALFGASKIVAIICTALFMASMSAGSNVTVSMATTVFGRQDFENAWPVISVPFKIIESFGIMVVSLLSAGASFKTSYLILAGILIVSLILMAMTTTKTIASNVHGENN